MHAVIAAAEALDETLIALLGHPDYYPRFGFVPAAELEVISPDPAWGAAFQARRLTATAPRGAFRYAEPFEQLG
jgi:predicted N-acetyltransferase YhbS